MQNFLRSFFIILSILLTLTTTAFAQTLYATDGRSNTSSTLYELDPTDGSIIRTIGSTGVSGLNSLAENPVTGILYAISTGGGGGTANLYTLNKNTGVATLIGPLNEPSGKPDMAFRSDGTLFTYTTSNGYLGTVNLTTGLMTLIGDTLVSPWDIGLTFDSSGTLIMTDGDTVYTVDTSTGVATSIASMSPVPYDSNMMTTHPDTGVIYLGDSDNSSTFLLYTLNTSTGALTLLGTNPTPNMCAIAFGDHSGPSTSIPTMSEWGMIIMSLILAGSAFWMMRRRQAL